MYAFDVLTALRDIHKYNIIHCDIKPQNFLLFKVDQDNQVIDEEEEEADDNDSMASYDPNTMLKVTDFGLAHIINRDSDKAYMKFRAGTHEYIAPEIKDVKI
jgi:serine/threonine protein kinase